MNYKLEKFWNIEEEKYKEIIPLIWTINLKSFEICIWEW